MTAKISSNITTGIRTAMSQGLALRWFAFWQAGFQHNTQPHEEHNGESPEFCLPQFGQSILCNLPFNIMELSPSVKSLNTSIIPYFWPQRKDDSATMTMKLLPFGLDRVECGKQNVEMA